MTSSNQVRSLEELLTKLKDIIGNWHRGTRPGNDGNQGNTLEDLLGIEENNLSIPDFGEFEIKTQKLETGSLITLFHKEPQPGGSVPQLLLSLGWKHDKAGTLYPANEMSFRSTTPSNRFTSRGLRIKLTPDVIQLMFDPTKVAINQDDATGAYRTYGEWLANVKGRTPHYTDVLPVTWDRAEFESKCIEKLDNTIFVECKTRTAKDGSTGRPTKEFMFTQAYLLKGFNGSKLEQIFSEGHMYIDFDARTGHNHGTKLRIQKTRIMDLFSYSEQVV